MSILGSGAETILPLWFVISFIVALGTSAALAVATGVFRPESVVGPDRRLNRRLALQLTFVLIMALCIWMLTQVFYIKLRGLAPPPGQPAREMKLSLVDKAFFFSVPQLAFFAALWLGDWAIGGFDLFDRLGFTLRRIARGLFAGVIAAVVILPPTYALDYVAEWFYQRVQYSHPHEHELLKLMSEPESRMVQIVFILTAVVIAPLAEEFLFRGHIQTLLRRTFILMSTPGFAETDPEGAPPRPKVWQTWLAILITSCLFALVHERWMWPTIFFLSLALGYCYERTGSLWTSMTVHCLFNSVTVFIYLKMSSP